MRGPKISETAQKFMSENSEELETLRKMIFECKDGKVTESEYNEKNLDFTNRATESCGKDCGCFLLCYIKDGKNVTSL